MHLMNGTTLWQKQGTTERGELNETVDHITSMPSQIRRASLQAKPDPDGYSKRQLLSWKRKRNQNRLPHHALRSSTPWPFAHRSGDQRLCHGSVALTLTQLPALEKIGAFMLGLYVSVDG